MRGRGVWWAALSLACACATPAWSAPVPLGGIATCDLPPRGSHQRCAPGDLERLNLAISPARVLFCGSIADPSGLRVRYDFHRTGRLAQADRDPLDSAPIASTLSAREAAGGAQFVGWRLRPVRQPDRLVLRWAYDVRKDGIQQTLSFAAIPTREGVLVFTRLGARAAGFENDERAFTALLARVSVLPGRRWEDGGAGEVRARFGLADLAALRGLPPAGAAARGGTSLPLLWISLVAGGLVAAIAAAVFLLRRRPRDRSAGDAAEAEPERTPAATERAAASIEPPGPLAPVGGLRQIDSSGAPLGPLGRRLLGQVESLARDLTPADLSFAPATRGELDLRLVIRQGATFDITSTSARGRLPSGVHSVASGDELRDAAGRQLAGTRRDCGSRIDAWARQFGANYESVLTADVCLGPQPVFGREVPCAACSGRGRVTCPACGGRTELTCSNCNGRGRTSCWSCHGLGRVNCGSCGGSGTQTEQYSTQEWDSGQNAYVTRYGTRSTSCGGCGGSGKTNCLSCWSGEVNCNGCGGRGSVSCGTCGAIGEVSCGACNGTGSLHELARVVCATDRKIALQVTNGDPEDQRTFVERVPLGHLSALGEVRLADTRRQENEITLAYASRVAFEAAVVTALGRPLAIRGYGPAADVFDHHGLVGALIEPDLAALEATLAAGRWWRVSSGPGLIAATRRFLASELHTLAVEAGPAPKGGTVAAAEPHVARGLVDREHVARAAAAGTKAVARLQDALVRASTLWLLIATAAALFAAQVVAVAGLHPFQRCLVVLAFAAVAWAVVELRTRRRLRAMLGTVLYPRLKRPFAAAWGRYRLIFAAGLLAALLGTAFLVYRFALGRM